VQVARKGLEIVELSAHMAVNTDAVAVRMTYSSL
jgi:hypothetical protein